MKTKQHIDMNRRMCHLPNKMHLQACIEGGNIYRNRKAYSRKGKDKFDLRKELRY